MNSTTSANFSLFTHPASLSMLQSMQSYASPLRQLPSYFISNAALPQHNIGLKPPATTSSLHSLVPPPPLTPSTNGSLLNARLLSPATPTPAMPTATLTATTEAIKTNQDDVVTGELVQTTLEGKDIYAFSVGGEKRLCLPQVLNNVLLCAGVTLSDINSVCENLNICCKRCNSQQMAILKERKVFGPNLESCGLITKSDAERLCKALLTGRTPKYNGSMSSEDGIGVFHNCFGKQRGFLIPRLYIAPEAPCIVCHGCSGLFNPAQFVGHAHARPERETCHWGFDSTNWRRYLQLDKRLTDSSADGCLADSERVCLEKILENFKAKFERKRTLVEQNGPELTKRMKEENLDDSSADMTIKFIPPSIISPGPAKVSLPQQLPQGNSVNLKQDGMALLSQKDPNSHRDFAPNVRLTPAIRLAQKLESFKEDCEQPEEAPASIEDTIASDWESLTDWGEGHLPEKATPQFLQMVEKVKSGYQSRIDDMNSLLGQLRGQLADKERTEQELQRLRRQLEEQKSPDIRKLRMKYSAQKDEIRHLEAERERLQRALDAALVTKKDGGVGATRPAAGAAAVPAAVRNGRGKSEEDGPPPLEMQYAS